MALLAQALARLGLDRLRGGNLSVGGRGERLAAKYLKKQGYRIVARNLRNRFGEVDLLAEAPDARTIVIVEVKTGEGGPIAPEVRVNHHKQRKLARLGAQIAKQLNFQNRPIRFDIIGVDLPQGQEPRVRHYIAAFESPW